MTYPAVCPGHSKAIVELSYSVPSAEGVYFISACVSFAAKAQAGFLARTASPPAA